MPEIHVERGGDNVFEDVGFDKNEARVLLAKSKLVVAIRSMIEDAGWTQTEASGIIGMTQPCLSRMLRGDFNEISETKLLDCLVRLGCDIKVTIGRRRAASIGRKRKEGRFQVVQT